MEDSGPGTLNSVSKNMTAFLQEAADLLSHVEGNWAEGNAVKTDSMLFVVSATVCLSHIFLSLFLLPDS